MLAFRDFVPRKLPPLEGRSCESETESSWFQGVRFLKLPAQWGQELCWKRINGLADCRGICGTGEKVIPTFCAMCGPSLGCGIYAYVKDGRFTRVEGMQESPLNGGRICAKAHAAPQWVYSPQRLKYPLRRVGKKGEGKFERISWDQALDLIAAKLKEQKQKYGPESLAILSPARRSYSEYLYRFLIAHGSPNYAHSGICAMQKAFAFTYTLGTAPYAGYPQYQASPDLGQATGLFRKHPGQPEADPGRKRPRDQDHFHQAHDGAGCGSFRYLDSDKAWNRCRFGIGNAQRRHQRETLRFPVRCPVDLRF